jgi:hypothetical protein
VQKYKLFSINALLFGVICLFLLLGMLNASALTSLFGLVANVIVSLRAYLAAPGKGDDSLIPRSGLKSERERVMDDLDREATRRRESEQFKRN